MAVIYMATNKINGKSYIGHTNNLQRRKREHRKGGRDLEKYSPNKTSAFYRAINKYGFENFEWHILEECSDDLDIRKKLEQKYILKYGTYGKGYNLTPGGEDSKALQKWLKDNPERHKAMAQKNMKKCQQWCKEHKQQHLAQLNEVRQKGIDATKRKVKCLETGEVFESLAEAERWSCSSKNKIGKKASHQGISRVCRGKSKTCGGYRWEYA